MQRYYIAVLTAVSLLWLTSCSDTNTESGVEEKTTGSLARRIPVIDQSPIALAIKTTNPVQCAWRFTYNGIKTKYTDLPLHKALVKTPDGRSGYACWDYSSAAAARKACRRACRDYFNLNCKLVDTDGKQCGGILKITAPSGGEKWITGKRYTIKWKKGNAGRSVKIQLLKGGKVYETIHNKTKNDGRHSWKILSSVQTGSAYKVKITSVDVPSVSDSSNKNFTIAAPTLTVTRPNGGESWEVGERYAIKWEKADAGSYVGIYLHQSGRYFQTISEKTENDGRYFWTVPDGIAYSNVFKIQVKSELESNMYDESDANFTIRDELPNGNYRYLYRLNASESSGSTVRWSSKRINVSGANSSSWKSEFNRWSTVSFNFGASGGITIAASSAVRDEVCGDALPLWYANGELYSCRIRINSKYDPFDENVGCTGVIAHEVGHCIGIFKHTSDGGLMDPVPAVSNGRITTPLRNMISLLYSLDPGTDINSMLSGRAVNPNLKNSTYRRPNNTTKSKFFITPRRK